MITSRWQELNSELDRIIAVLIQEYQPVKIILFGSVASGDIHDWSDIDLLIVKDTNKSFYDRLEEVIEIAKPDIGADILVYTPEEIDQIKEDLFFKEEVFGKGRVLFDQYQ